MRQQWQALSVRERNLAKLVAIVIGLFLFWLMVWRPLVSTQASMSDRLERQRADLVWMQAAAEEARRLGGESAESGNRGDISLLALAEQSARGLGLSVGFRRGEPVGDDRVRVSFEAVAFDRLVEWLVLLDGRYGVRAEELSVDRSGSPGIVDARVLLAE